jgi:multiple antibiotic resistance protein
LKTFLLAFGALFSFVNPFSGAFIFFGATRELEPCVRAQVSRWIAIYAFFIVTASLYVGAYVLSFFGVSTPVLRVAGIVVALSGWRMLSEPDATEQRRSETPAPRSIDVPPSRLAFYPLTMPLTTGPGDDLGGDIARRRTAEWLGRQRACKLSLPPTLDLQITPGV